MDYPVIWKSYVVCCSEGLIYFPIFLGYRLTPTCVFFLIKSSCVCARMVKIRPLYMLRFFQAAFFCGRGNIFMLHFVFFPQFAIPTTAQYLHQTFLIPIHLHLDRLNFHTPNSTNPLPRHSTQSSPKSEPSGPITLITLPFPPHAPICICFPCLRPPLFSQK